MAALIPAYIKSENTSTQTRHLRQKREKVTPKSVVILSPHKVHFNVELIQFDGHTRSFIVNQLSFLWEQPKRLNNAIYKVKQQELR